MSDETYSNHLNFSKYFISQVVFLIVYFTLDNLEFRFAKTTVDAREYLQLIFFFFSTRLLPGD